MNNCNQLYYLFLPNMIHLIISFINLPHLPKRVVVGFFSIFLCVIPSLLGFLFLLSINNTFIHPCFQSLLCRKYFHLNHPNHHHYVQHCHHVEHCFHFNTNGLMYKQIPSKLSTQSLIILCHTLIMFTLILFATPRVSCVGNTLIMLTIVINNINNYMNIIFIKLIHIV